MKTFTFLFAFLSLTVLSYAQTDYNLLKYPADFNTWVDTKGNIVQQNADGMSYPIVVGIDTVRFSAPIGWTKSYYQNKCGWLSPSWPGISGKPGDFCMKYDWPDSPYKWATWHYSTTTIADVNNTYFQNFKLFQGDDYYFTFWAKKPTGMTNVFIYMGCPTLYDPQWALMPRFIIEDNWKQFGYGGTCQPVTNSTLANNITAGTAANADQKSFCIQLRNDGIDYAKKTCYIDDLDLQWGTQTFTLKPYTSTPKVQIEKVFKIKMINDKSITFESVAGDVYITSISGKILNTIKVTDGINKIMVPQSGIYLITLNNKKVQYTYKVIVD